MKKSKSLDFQDFKKNSIALSNIFGGAPGAGSASTPDTCSERGTQYTEDDCEATVYCGPTVGGK